MNNKELIEKYPFLLPRNRFTGEIPEDYDYSWTELDAMSDGWRKAFGIDMCEEIRIALGDYVEKYRITQIKEKYGELRWYDFGAPEGVEEIINKYTKLSRKTCIICGKPATRVSIGWIMPFCDECGGSRSFEKIEE